MELYCETCGETICYKCAIKEGKHHNHEYKELSKAFEKYIIEISASLEPMAEKLIITESALVELDLRCEEVSDQQAEIESEMNSTFKHLQEVLEERRVSLISQLHQMAGSKFKNLTSQRDQLETTQAQLNSCVEVMRGVLKMESRGDLLAQCLTMRTALVKQVKELTATVQQNSFQPNAEADMAFTASSEIATVFQNYGKISALSSPDPLKCYATGKGIVAAVVGETATALLQAIDFRGQPCEEPILSIECELVSELTGTRTRGSVERRGQSQYEISYQPTIKGRHKLHIKVEGQHIRASPFSVSTKSPVEKIGTPICTFDIAKPWGIAINRQGELIVTEIDNNCVSIFTATGEKLRSFGVQGLDNGQFVSPNRVAVDNTNNIYVVDCDNHRVQKFTAKGHFLTSLNARAITRCRVQR